MPRRDWRIALLQMLEYAERCIETVGGLSGAELEADYLHSSSAARTLELIGEAAKRVPATVQADFPQLPWSQLVGLRNVLIHRYDEVNYHLVATIVAVELPRLIEELRKIIEQETT